MTVFLAMVARLAGIAALAGALFGSWAWVHAEGDRQARMLRQARWLYLSGLAGITLWAVIVAFGALTRGCDPLFGGWSRLAGIQNAGLPPCP